ALAGERLGLFARTGQLSLKSGEGPAEVQAQNASLRLFAEKKLTLSSASDISFAGKKRITLIGGGSYLRLEAGKVEYGTTATYMRRVKRTMAAARSALPLNTSPLPPPATMREFNPETLTPWVTPVYAKSCLKEKGCTDAGTTDEPVENFGQMTIFAQSVEDDCCGYGHQHAHEEVVQHAQSAKKRIPGAGSEKAPAEASAAPLALGAATGVMTQVWGEWSLTGVLGAARGIPYVGAMMSALYVPSAGEGSSNVPGRDEFWYEEELRQKALTGAKATTRVRFFWRQDEQGNMRVYGVHTGEGTPYEGVRTAEMKWVEKNNRYEFTPAHGVDGPLITWTPESPENGDIPSHTGSNISPIDQATILVTPIPDGKDEYTTPPFPVPEERDLNDYILVFPVDSGIKPIYVYLNEVKTSYTHGYKHYPPKNKPWSEVVKNTKSGPAKFKPEVNIESIDHDVWENGTPTTNGQNWKIKEFDSVQGAYKGKETNWVVTKESQGTIHSHPIGPQEAGKLIK
ncbi:S-type pyocin domain-containing protein, partial [Klebsiella pneumoniae]